MNLYQQGIPYVQTGDYETAIQFFEWANDIYKGRPEANVILGQIYAQLRDHDAAIANLNKAIAFAGSETMLQMLRLRFHIVYLSCFRQVLGYFA